MTFYLGHKSGFHVGSPMVHGPGVNVHPDEEEFKSKPVKTVRLVNPLSLGPKQWTFLFIMGEKNDSVPLSLYTVFILSWNVKFGCQGPAAFLELFVQLAKTFFFPPQ